MFVNCWCGSRFWWSEVCGSDHTEPCARCGETAQRRPDRWQTLCPQCVVCDDCDELVAVDEQLEHRQACGRAA